MNINWSKEPEPDGKRKSNANCNYESKEKEQKRDTMRQTPTRMFSCPATRTIILQNLFYAFTPRGRSLFIIL